MIPLKVSMHQVGLSAAFKSKIDLKSKFDCLPILLILMQGPQSKERAAEMLKFSSATLRGFTMGADVSPNTLPPLQPPNSRQRAIVWIGIVWKGTNFINLLEIFKHYYQQYGNIFLFWSKCFSNISICRRKLGIISIFGITF